MFRKNSKQTGPIVTIDPKKYYVECIYLLLLFSTSLLKNLKFLNEPPKVKRSNLDSSAKPFWGAK